MSGELGFTRWTWSQGQFRVSFPQPIKGGCVEHNPLREIPMLVELSEEQVVTCEVQPVTGKGNPAAIDGEVLWTLSDDQIAKLDVDPTDSKKATITAKPVDGAKPADVTAIFDADLGAGVRHITAIGQIVVKDAEAVTAEISFGTPT